MPAELKEYCRKADFVFNLVGVNRPKDPSVELEMPFIDDPVEEMFDALECKKHHCEFDGVNTLLTENSRYCDAPVTHKATLGYIVECLHRFHDQPQMLVMPEIPNGSFEKKLYPMYLSYLPKEKVAFSLKMNLDARGSFTELLKTEKCGQVSVNISKPGITKGQHWHNSKWNFSLPCRDTDSFRSAVSAVTSARI